MEVTNHFYRTNHVDSIVWHSFHVVLQHFENCQGELRDCGLETSQEYKNIERLKQDIDNWRESMILKY